MQIGFAGWAVLSNANATQGDNSGTWRVWDECPHSGDAGAPCGKGLPFSCRKSQVQSLAFAA